MPRNEANRNRNAVMTTLKDAGLQPSIGVPLDGDVFFVYAWHPKKDVRLSVAENGHGKFRVELHEFEGNDKKTLRSMGYTQLRSFESARLLAKDIGEKMVRGPAAVMRDRARASARDTSSRPALPNPSTKRSDHRRQSQEALGWSLKLQGMFPTAKVDATIKQIQVEVEDDDAHIHTWNLYRYPRGYTVGRGLYEFGGAVGEDEKGNEIFERKFVSDRVSGPMSLEQAKRKIEDEVGTVVHGRAGWMKITKKLREGGFRENPSVYEPHERAKRDAVSAAIKAIPGVVFTAKMVPYHGKLLKYDFNEILEVGSDRELTQRESDKLDSTIEKLGWRAWGVGKRGIAFKPSGVDLSVPRKNPTEAPSQNTRVVRLMMKYDTECGQPICDVLSYWSAGRQAPAKSLRAASGQVQAIRKTTRNKSDVAELDWLEDKLDLMTARKNPSVAPIRSDNLEKFGLQPTPGGEYLEMPSRKVITGQIHQSGHIDVSAERPSFFVSDTQVSSLAAKGRLAKANLFRQAARWKWVEGGVPTAKIENTPVIVSVEVGSKHLYALRVEFRCPMQLKTYPNAKTEPRLRPTARITTVVTENVIGTIRTAGKQHNVYEKIVLA